MVTWPKFKWWLHLGSWTAKPCSKAAARVVEAKIKPSPSLGSPWSQPEFVRSKTAIEEIRWYGWSLLCGIKPGDIPWHSLSLSILVQGGFSQTHGATKEYSGILEHCSSQVVPLWIVSCVKWYILHWPICSFCFFVHTRVHTSWAQSPDQLDTLTQ